MDRQTIADRLYATAKRSADSRKYEFGAGADYEMRKLAGEAADRILQRSPTDANLRPLVGDGERAFERIVDEMIKSPHARRNIDPSKRGIIGEETLRDARNALCPLWPIC
jgi:hypothetical protein